MAKYEAEDIQDILHTCDALALEGKPITMLAVWFRLISTECYWYSPWLVARTLRELNEWGWNKVSQRFEKAF